MNQFPKVLQVLPSLQTGGAEKTAVDISKALIMHGWGSCVASSGGRLVGQLQEQGATHSVLPLDSKNPITIWRNAQRLADLIRQQGIDLIHARSRSPAWSAYWAARKTGIPFVTTHHGAYGQKNAVKAWYNSVMGKADAIIAVSEWTAELVSSRYPHAADRIITIPRGTDFGVFDNTKIGDQRRANMRQQWGLEVSSDQNEVIVLLLARMTPLKGHSTLIEAAAKLKNEFPKTKFIMAGDGHNRDDYIEGLRQKISSYGLGEMVLMPGHCDDPAAAMAISDIVVSASVQPEAFGRTVAEAAGLKKPVIVTNIGAAPGNVLTPPRVNETKRSGWVFQPGDSEELYEKLLLALTLSPQSREKMGSHARDHAVKNFSLSQMCEKTIGVYKSLLTNF